MENQFTEDTFKQSNNDKSRRELNGDTEFYSTHHWSRQRKDVDFGRPMTFTPEDLYTLAVDYIEDDHADGKGNPENNLTERDKETIAFIVNIVEKEGIIEKKGSMQLPSPLSTEIKQALESRGYEVTNTKVNLK